MFILICGISWSLILTQMQTGFFSLPFSNSGFSLQCKQNKYQNTYRQDRFVFHIPTVCKQISVLTHGRGVFQLPGVFIQSSNSDERYAENTLEVSKSLGFSGEHKSPLSAPPCAATLLPTTTAAQTAAGAGTKSRNHTNSLREARGGSASVARAVERRGDDGGGAHSHRAASRVQTRHF